MASYSPSSDHSVPLKGEEARERVAVLVDEIAEAEALEFGDTAPAQSTASVIHVLDTLGYEPVELALQADRPDDWLRRVIEGDFHLAFNLCETVGGQSDSEHLPAAAIELLGLPKTGATAATLLHCLDKDLCSAVLRAHDISVPEWRFIDEDEPVPEKWDRFPAIVKPLAEDASNGVHSNSVAYSRDELQRAVAKLGEAWGALIVQEFIDGREINLAIVGNYLLPPSEIDFSTLPEGAPPIVSFEAKWAPGSAEDQGTRPICPAPLEAGLAESLQLLTARAWTLMGGEGYARVDVRLSPSGVPYVIDVNPNPDLSPDAGLARQARSAGWSYEDLISKIIEDALNRHRIDRAASAVEQPPHPHPHPHHPPGIAEAPLPVARGVAPAATNGQEAGGGGAGGGGQAWIILHPDEAEPESF